MQLIHTMNSSEHNCITNFGPHPVSYNPKVRSQSLKWYERTPHQDCGFRFFSWINCCIPKYGVLGPTGREDLVVAVVVKDTYLPSDSIMCWVEPWGREPGGPKRLGSTWQLTHSQVPKCFLNWHLSPLLIKSDHVIVNTQFRYPDKPPLSVSLSLIVSLTCSAAFSLLLLLFVSHIIFICWLLERARMGMHE